MKQLDSYVEIWDQGPGIEGIKKQIEKVGRICYKSESNITEDSAEKFVERLGNAGHLKAFEQGTVYLTFPRGTTFDETPKSPELYLFYFFNRYSKCRTSKDDDNYYVTTNYRVLVDNDRVGDLKYLTEPSKDHELRVCAHFICDRGVSAEANRHTMNSAMETSTRYCNYSLDKFGNEISVIQSDDIDLSKANYDGKDFFRMCEDVRFSSSKWNEVDLWMFGNLATEFSYMGLLKRGWKPQQARRVLPLDLKTEVCHSAFVSDWIHFFELRSAPDAHPDMKKLSDQLKKLFVERGYIEHE